MKLLDSGATLPVSGIATNVATLFWDYLLENKTNTRVWIYIPNDTLSYLFNVAWWNIAHFKDEIDSEQTLHISSKTWAHQLIFTSK